MEIYRVFWKFTGYFYPLQYGHFPYSDIAGEGLGFIRFLANASRETLFNPLSPPVDIAREVV